MTVNEVNSSTNNFYAEGYKYVSSPFAAEETESNYFLDNQKEEENNDSLSPEEYMAQMQTDKQEFNEVMQMLQNVYWLKLQAEDGDAYAIEQLNSIDLGDGEYSNAANQAIFNDIVNIKQEGLELVTNDNNSLDEQALYNLIAQNNQDKSEAEIRKMVEKVAISYS